MRGLEGWWHMKVRRVLGLQIERTSGNGNGNEKYLGGPTQLFLFGQGKGGLWGL